MKIVFVNYVYHNALAGEEELLRQYYTVVGWAEALQRRGMDVCVISRFYRNTEIEQNGVRYFFVKDKLSPQFRSRQIPFSFLKKVASLEADVIHLHQFTLSLQTIWLRWLAKKSTALVIQHHGGPPVLSHKMHVHHFLNRVADGYFFTTHEQGKQWFRNEVQLKKVMAVMEGATFFHFDSRDASFPRTWQPRIMARDTTGMQGNPVCLWVGRLDRNKDPLTVLNGFEQCLRHLPHATLYMIYHEEPLLNVVKDRISRSASLRTQVHLLGRVPHETMAAYYQSADLFVLGSHYEGSGYALSEALRCGCVPVITDIPSFRMMTNNGRLGKLWHAGDATSFAHALQQAAESALPQQGQECLNYYYEMLSFDAIARIAETHYEQMVKQRRRKRLTNPYPAQ